VEVDWELQVELVLDREVTELIQLYLVQDLLALHLLVVVVPEILMDHPHLEDLVVLVVVLVEILVRQLDLPLLLDKEILVVKVQLMVHHIDMVAAVVVLVEREHLPLHQTLAVVEVEELVFKFLAYSIIQIPHLGPLVVV
jgi:hypothetical protein